MGLDQRSYWVDGTMQINTWDGKERLVENDFKVWRKCSHIQDWMQRLYAKKTGITDPHEFNCVSVILTKDDVALLIKDIDEGNMQCVSGFFFGGAYDVSEQKEDDMEFAVQCLKHIMLGRTVMYSSWW